MNRGIRHPPDKRHDLGESRHGLRLTEQTSIERRILDASSRRRNDSPAAPAACVLSEPTGLDSQTCAKRRHTARQAPYPCRPIVRIG